MRYIDLEKLPPEQHVTLHPEECTPPTARPSNTVYTDMGALFLDIKIRSGSDDEVPRLALELHRKTGDLFVPHENGSIGLTDRGIGFMEGITGKEYKQTRAAQPQISNTPTLGIIDNTQMPDLPAYTSKNVRRRPQPPHIALHIRHNVSKTLLRTPRPKTRVQISWE